ncbi:hypothetical protein [Flavobacterium akiainvivens]|nr:hypothetical protein [Flavobacterium akiainvivens]SFQ58423.1 hypothetical protein SAMN05444144_1095 [Flavobacterium akiainvivens]
MQNKPNDHFKPMTVEELNRRIDQSEDDFKNGRYKTSAEMLEKFKDKQP